MAIGIDSVTQVKEFDVASQALTGFELYYVMFSYDSLDELDNYAQLAGLCLTAVDPVTGLAIPQYSTQLTGFETWVTDVTPRIYKNQQSWWIVRVDYAPPDFQNEQPETFNDDPTNIEIIYDWSNVNEKVKIWEDANGVPINMSSKEGPTALPVIDNDILSCTVSRRTNTYSPLVARAVVNTINDANFSIDGFTFGKGEVKCKAWRGRKRDAIVQKDGQPPTPVVYVDESLVFMVKEEPWTGRVFDQGLFFDNPGVGGDPDLPVGRHQLRRNGQLVRTAQPLNGAGLPIFDDDGNIKNAVVAAAYDPVGGTPGVEAIFGGKGAMLVFQFWKESDFSVTGVT